jgi:hypothetical protein
VRVKVHAANAGDTEYNENVDDKKGCRNIGWRRIARKVKPVEFLRTQSGALLEFGYEWLPGTAANWRYSQQEVFAITHAPGVVELNIEPSELRGAWCCHPNQLCPRLRSVRHFANVPVVQLYFHLIRPIIGQLDRYSSRVSAKAPAESARVSAVFSRRQHHMRLWSFAIFASEKINWRHSSAAAEYETDQIETHLLLPIKRL